MARATTHIEKFIAANGTKSGFPVRSLRAEYKAPVKVPMPMAVPKIP